MDLIVFVSQQTKQRVATHSPLHTRHQHINRVYPQPLLMQQTQLVQRLSSEQLRALIEILRVEVEQLRRAREHEGVWDGIVVGRGA